MSITCCARSAAELPEAFENEDFDFWQRYLTGRQAAAPANVRCVAAVDRALGDLLGQKYIDVAFGGDAKAQIAQLVDALEKALGQDIQSAAVDERRHQEGRAGKAEGHHQQRGRAAQVARLRQGRHRPRRLLGQRRARHRVLHRAAHPAHRQAHRQDRVDHDHRPPSTPSTAPHNSINFPAGILQPPFFDPRRDMAVNYGAVGAVIGHEMTHGFDDQGRKYDGDGNLRDWWTPHDGAEFEKRAACVANEYSGFTAVDDVKLNGRLTLGENTADNGGMRVALHGAGERAEGKEREARRLHSRAALLPRLCADLVREQHAAGRSGSRR